MNALEHRQKAGQLVDQARAILDRADSERRSMTSAEQREFDRLHTDTQRNLDTAESKERQEIVDLTSSAGQRRLPPDDFGHRAGGEALFGYDSQSGREIRAPRSA